MFQFSSRHGALAFLLATSTVSAATDPFDEAKMDLQSAPAKLSTTRHTGAFASGPALSAIPLVQPLDPAPEKTIAIDTSHKVIEIAPGVSYSAWTFGDRVPGPIVRSRVGDRIHFSMTNRSDEVAPGALSFAAPMMHSMDFHAAMVSPQDKYRSIAPGQTIAFDFTPNYPGVFMYHCGTPMILEHIASGMYGVVIVEPREGYPTKVDREFVVVQSEFYTKPDPEGRKIGGGVLNVLDTERVKTKAPTYTVFNGRYNGLVEHPLVAKPGERVRLFVLNVGPSNTSSFHVVGAIFDRVWLDGNPYNELRGMQTVLLGSSSSAIVEFRIPDAGKYIMVDHHFANASQGAVGLVDATGGAESGDLEHHNIPETATPVEPEAVKGKLAFEGKCIACHSVGGGDKLGPDLLGVTTRRTDEWLARWLANPAELLKHDAEAQALQKKFTLAMPDQGLSEAEINHLVRYFHWFDARGKAVKAVE